MWFQFLLAVVVALISFFVPGYLLLSCSFKFKNGVSLVLAPAVSTAIVATVSILLSELQIPCTFCTVIAAPSIALLIIALVFLAIRSKRTALLLPDKKLPSLGWRPIALYLAWGLIMVGILFVRNLDGADSLFQAYDNWSHLAKVHTFLETSNFSPFLSIYQDVASPYLDNLSFYPSAWYSFVASVAGILNAPITLAVNAVNSVLMGAVFPLGMLGLLYKLFPAHHDKLYLGAFIVLSCAFCPWDFVVFGPLYPNLLAIAVLPAAMVFFMEMTDLLVMGSIRSSMLHGTLFVVSAVGVAMAHPNGIFTMAVFLAPFIVSRLYCTFVDSKGSSRSVAFVISCGAALIIALIWMVCYKLPQMASVVSHNWPAVTNISQAVVDTVAFGFNGRPAQLVLSLLCILGIIKIVQSRDTRWLVFPYLFSCLQYVLCTATDGRLKHITSGFWYTDPQRIAVMVGLFSVPLLFKGLITILKTIDSCLTRYMSIRGLQSPVKSTAISLIVLITLVYYPSFSLNGIGRIEQAFSSYSSSVETQNAVAGNHVLTAAERKFARDAVDMIPEGSLIINSPNDGSAFLYSLDNINVYYRKFDLPSSSFETRDSQVIRSNLSDLTMNTEVYNSLVNIGAQYLLLLDQGEDSGENRQRFWPYRPDQWVGIESVNDSTPGFTLLLSRDDMRLYRIETS